LINQKPFLHLKDVAYYFNVRPSTIAKHLDTNVATGRRGLLVYTFTRELDSKLKVQLLLSKTTKIALTRYFNQKVWVYDAISLKLINNAPFSSVKLASSYLGTNRETIKNHLDTMKAVKLRATSKIFYYFSHELGDELKAKLTSLVKPIMSNSYGRKSL